MWLGLCIGCVKQSKEIQWLKTKNSQLVKVTCMSHLPEQKHFFMALESLHRQSGSISNI